LIGATGGSIVTAGTGSIAIGGASLTGGETVGAMGEVLSWSTTGASSVCAGSMVSVDKPKPATLPTNDPVRRSARQSSANYKHAAISIPSSTALVISLLSPVIPSSEYCIVSLNTNNSPPGLTSPYNQSILW